MAWILVALAAVLTAAVVAVLLQLRQTLKSAERTWRRWRRPGRHLNDTLDGLTATLTRVNHAVDQLERRRGARVVAPGIAAWDRRHGLPGPLVDGHRHLARLGRGGSRHGRDRPQVADQARGAGAGGRRRSRRSRRHERGSRRFGSEPAARVPGRRRGRRRGRAPDDTQERARDAGVVRVVGAAERRQGRGVPRVRATREHSTGPATPSPSVPSSKNRSTASAAQNRGRRALQ